MSEDIRVKMAEQNPVLLAALDAAVPLWILEFRELPREEVLGRARGLEEVIAAHGDDLLFGGRRCAEAFNAVAKGIAALSFCPGGVTVFGRHWEADAEPFGMMGAVDDGEEDRT